MRRNPRSLADLLPTALPQMAERLLEYRIRRAWAAAVGPEVARRSQPQMLVNGCLQVVVDNSPWLHELTLRASDLAARLDAEFGGVRSVRFVLGALESPGTGGERRDARPDPPLTEAELREIDEAVSAIHDPALATSARRLLAKARRSTSGRGAVR